MSSFEQKLQKVRSQRLHDLRQDTLEKLVSSIEAERVELESELDELSASLQADLARSDARRFRMMQGRARRLGEQNIELKDQLEDVQKALRHRILEDRLIGRLGSRFRLISLDIFIAILIITVLGMLFWEFTVDLSGVAPLAEKTIWAMFLIDTACCVIFMVDFFLRMSCSDSKLRYFRDNWIDFVTSIPIPPGDTLSRAIRFGRLLRFVRILRFLRLIRVAVLFWRGMDKLKEVTDVKLMKRSLWWSSAAMLLGGIAVVYFERTHAGVGPPEVGNLPQGLWWSFTTMVVGGYGDIHNPESFFGRMLTVLLVIIGMILTGIFTATLTAIVVGDESEEFRNQMEDMKESVDRINTQLAERDAPEG